MRFAPLVLAIAVAGAACNVKQRLDDGTVACGPQGQCPDGLMCVKLARTTPISVCCADQTCSRINPERDSGPDMPDSPDALDTPPEASGEVEPEDAPADVPDMAPSEEPDAPAEAGEAGCADACQPGAQRCGPGGGIQICREANGCRAWGDETLCPGRQKCLAEASGVRCACPPRPPACEKGAGTFCESTTTVATCVSDPDGCVQIAEERTTCPAGKPCSGVHPTASCSCSAPPTACASGAGKSCQGNTEVMCALDTNGCLAVASMSNCPAGKPCSGIAPNVACSCPPPPADCTQAGRVCRGNNLVVCGLDANSCMAAISTEACPGVQTCTGGAPDARCTCPTAPVSCAAGQGAFCEWLTTIGICSSDPQGCVSVTGRVTCPVTKPCTGTHPMASCSCPPPPPECVAGAGNSCQGNTLVRCAVDQNGCLAVASSTACPIAKPCAGTAPNAACTCPPAPPDCGGPGNVCRPNQVLATCGLTADGCLTTTATTTCPVGRPCMGFHPTAACTCPTPPAGCNGQGSGTYCASSAVLATCSTAANGCVQAHSTTCTGRCAGTHPSAMCVCVPSCDGRCGGPDGCGGVCPNACVAPLTCGGGGTANVCGCQARVTDFAAGGDKTCARKSDGTLWCWGGNTDGQIGDGTTGAPKPTPTRVATLGTNVVQVATGRFGHACALREDGTVWCWGRNVDGEIGTGTTVTPQPTPVQVAGLPGRAVDVSASRNHTCARMSDLTLWCWGRNLDGQVGDPTRMSPRPSPFQVTALGPTVAQVSSGGFHTCVRRTNGTLACWGENLRGQIGDGTTVTPRVTPVTVAAVGTITDVAASYHTCARRSDGTLWCWGLNTFGHLGLGHTTSPVPAPTQVTSLGTNVVQVETAWNHTCARRQDGTVWCWGHNQFGQVGDGTTTDRHTPVQVTALGNTVTRISAGTNHSCAIRSDGTLWCWGSNQSGQMGDGTRGTNRETPAQVMLSCP